MKYGHCCLFALLLAFSAIYFLRLIWLALLPWHAACMPSLSLISTVVCFNDVAGWFKLEVFSRIWGFWGQDLFEQHANLLISLFASVGSRGWTRMDGCTMWITLRKGPPGTDLSLCLQGTRVIDSSFTLNAKIIHVVLFWKLHIIIF